MIPVFAFIRVGAHRWWIPLPLFVAGLLLLPLCLLALPFFLVGCRALDVPGGRALVTGFGLLRGLRGIRMDIEHPAATIAVRLI